METGLLSVRIIVLLLSFVFGVYSNTGQAENSACTQLDALNKKLADVFFNAEINCINQVLLKQQNQFKQNPALLVDYVDQTLMPIWSSQTTLRLIFSAEYWSEFPDVDKIKLTTGFNNTLHRYVQEGFEHYEGQQIEYVGVRLNKNKNRGYLTVRVIPNVLPSFTIDFKIGLFDDSWKLYDAMIEGVSYVALKKDSYQEKFEVGGIKAVIDYFNEKNQGYLPSKLVMTNNTGLTD